MTTLTSAAADGRRARGTRTRQSILEAAAQLATTAGLEGLSIGRLADHVGISKSGLYAHFRSKEELQLETIRTAGEIYTAQIVEPAMQQSPGCERLLALCDNFIDYLASGVFPGGCFFIGAALDPARLRNPVRRLLADGQREWLELLEDCARNAQDLGELRTDATPREIAFDVEGVLACANINYVLFDDAWYLEQGRAAARRCLRPAGD